MASLRRARAWLGLAALLATIGAGCAVATAAQRGTLSASEYSQLAASASALNRSASASTINWTKARAACNRVSKSTPLLRTQRAGCYGEINVLDALASFPAEQRRCPRTSSTTTTTSTSTDAITTATDTSTTSTTSAADSAQMRLMICMNPRYQSLSADAKALDVADVAARKQALARGFSGSCLAALVPTAADLSDAKRFASASAQLAADVTLLIKVTQDKLPADDFHQSRIQSDVKLFESSATAVLAEHGQPQLSVCPHQ